MLQLYTIDQSKIDIGQGRPYGARVDIDKSLIWTERFSQNGDFSLVSADIDRIRAIAPLGTCLVLEGEWGGADPRYGNRRVMRVETVNYVTDEETGSKTIKLTGRSLESVMNDRVAMVRTSTDWDPTDPWVINGTTPQIAQDLYQQVISSPNGTDPVSTWDLIDNFGTYSVQAGSEDFYDYKVKPGPLYDRIKELCDAYGYGFRLVLDGHYFFVVYKGYNRSASQNSRPKVIFDQTLGNLKGYETTQDTSGFKNVAYVVSGTKLRVVYRQKKTPPKPTVFGLNRRVLYVDASDIQNPTDALLDARGAAELGNYPSQDLADGTAIETDGSIYKKDYDLGDIVTIKDESGSYDKVVAEHIYSIDENGFASYPTWASQE